MKNISLILVLLVLIVLNAVSLLGFTHHNKIQMKRTFMRRYDGKNNIINESIKKNEEKVVDKVTCNELKVMS